jgi:RNA-directed DNA polymerase
MNELFETVGQNKPFLIDGLKVQRAYEQVRANKGSAGIDEQDLKSYDLVRKQELYKLWNRMSSGTYFPSAVRGVEIPKGDGKVRLLGIPTVSDRVAQQVVVNELSSRLETIFSPNSYGYRPETGAFDALEACRQNCYKHSWVIDMDIQGFFDNIDHELLMTAVRKHVNEKWILLYIERWLKAPMQMPNGEVVIREKGTPQGGVISPQLANLFLHYSFDAWMEKNHSTVCFERYADDIIVHCDSLTESTNLLAEIRTRFEECKLSLHPEKTKIIYCKDYRRKDDYPTVSFTFLGYTFRPIEQKSKFDGGSYTGFGPRMSNKAKLKIQEVLRSKSILRCTFSTIEDLAISLRAQIRGWINYYCHYDNGGKSELFRILDERLVIWIGKKFKKYRGRRKKSWKYLEELKRTRSHLFQHWIYTFGQSSTNQQEPYEARVSRTVL